MKRKLLQDALDSMLAAVKVVREAITDGVDAAEPGAVELTDNESAVRALLAMIDGSKGKAAQAPRAAKTELPRAAGSRVGVPTRPTVVYTMAPGYDRKRFNAQTNILGEVVQVVHSAGKSGVSAAQVVAKTKIKPKSVQSAMWLLRHTGLIQSRSAETGKPIR